MNNLILSMYRYLRIVSGDYSVPNKCNSVYYKIPKNATCDCKIWCKYPPPGRLMPIVIDCKDTTIAQRLK